jgi:peroxiredoxin
MGLLPLIPGTSVQATTSRYGIVGARAPAIKAEYWIGPNGRATEFSMSETEGRWVYLKCFQAWCPGCHKHGLPALKKVVDAFAGDRRLLPVAVQTVFEGFAVNSREKLRETQERYALPIKFGHDPGDPVYNDARPQTMRDFRTGGTPWVVIIDPQGWVVYNDYHIDADRFVEYLRQTLRA